MMSKVTICQSENARILLTSSGIAILCAKCGAPIDAIFCNEANGKKTIDRVCAVCGTRVKVTLVFI